MFKMLVGMIGMASSAEREEEAMLGSGVVGVVVVVVVVEDNEVLAVAWAKKLRMASQYSCPPLIHVSL